jgi:long-chain fatty acid transport protein
MFRLSTLGRALFSAVVVMAFILTQSLVADQEVTVGSDFGVGARAMGMGGAFTGVADDFTALHWNPAGLSHIRRMEVFGGLSHEKINNETEYFGNTDSTFTSNTRPNSFGMVFPIPTYRGGLAFAFGVNRVQSFDLRTSVKGFNELSVSEDPEFGQLMINEVTDESDGINSWDFGLAVDVAPNVALGATLSFLSGTYNYNLDLSASDSKQLDTKLDGLSYLDEITTDYFGVDGKLGLMAHFDRFARLGLTIAIPLSLTADEYWYQDSYWVYDDGTDESGVDEGTYSYDISRPIKFNAGVALRPIPGATIAADVGYTDWTQTEYSETPSEDVSNEDFLTDYRSTVKFSVGGEYVIPKSGLVLRAGYMLDPLPYKPVGTEIETERQYITFGIGLIMDGAFTIDAAYVKGFSKVNSDNVSKKLDSNQIFLSAGTRF